MYKLFEGFPRKIFDVPNLRRSEWAAYSCTAALCWKLRLHVFRASCKKLMTRFPAINMLLRVWNLACQDVPVFLPRFMEDNMNCATNIQMSDITSHKTDLARGFTFDRQTNLKVGWLFGSELVLKFIIFQSIKLIRKFMLFPFCQDKSLSIHKQTCQRFNTSSNQTFKLSWDRLKLIL